MCRVSHYFRVPDGHVSQKGIRCCIRAVPQVAQLNTLNPKSRSMFNVVFQSPRWTCAYVEGNSLALYLTAARYVVLGGAGQKCFSLPVSSGCRRTYCTERRHCLGGALNLRISAIVAELYPVVGTRVVCCTLAKLLEMEVVVICHVVDERK